MLLDCLFQSEVFIDMQKYESFLKRSLLSKTHQLNGYGYEFLDINWNESIFEFEVNVILPQKGGGYVLEKIYDDIATIVDNLFSYLGTSSTIRVQVLIEGQEVNSSYIPFEKIEEVFEYANENSNIIEFTIEKNKIKIELEYSPLFKRYRDTVQYDDGVLFIVYADIQKIYINGVESEPDLSSVDKETIFVSYLNENLERVSFEDSMYTVLEPQLQFGSSEFLYYNCHLRVGSYKGQKVEDAGGYADSWQFLTLFESFSD
jgi:hypothetical protein